MAIVSKFSHASATVDLNDVNTGFSMAGDGWLPAVATPVYGRDPEPIVETIHLMLKDTSQDNIATDMQALHFMQVKADEYINDPTVADPVWLHAKMANETGERRAVVHKIEVQYGASWYGDEATSIDVPVTLSVTRGPFWESTTARDMPAATWPAGSIVYTYDYTATGASVEAHDIVGDVGSRIRFSVFDPGTDQINNLYVGLRSANKHGTLANFVPVFELEDAGILGNDCATASATASSGGGHILVTAASVDWDDGSFHQVCQFGLNDASAGSENYGKFLSFIRVNTATSDWDLKIYYGFSNTYNEGRLIEASTDSSYHLYEGDIYYCRAQNVKAFQEGTHNFSIDVYASRTSGTSDLIVDCIINMPVDEGYLKTTYPLYYTQNDIQIAQSPHGQWDGNTLSGNLVMDIYNLVLPVGDGRAYITKTAIGNTTDLDDTMNINAADAGKYYERWLSLRGSE